MVEKLLNDYNLCLLNTGDPTYRHHSHNSFSVPDVSICDPSLALEFYHLTHNDLCGSDHFPVILSRSGELQTQKLKSHLLRTQSLNVLPLKPGVGQYPVHATLTVSDFFLANFYPSGPFTCIFPEPLPRFFCISCG